MNHVVRDCILVCLAVFALSCLDGATFAESQQAASSMMSDEDLLTVVRDAVGQEPSLKRSKHFRIITTVQDIDLSGLLELAEMVRANILKRFEMTDDPRFCGGTADFYIVRHENQYEALLESIQSRYQCGRRWLEFYRAHRARALALHPPVSVSIPAKTPGRNIIVNHTAKMLLACFVKKPKQLPAWLTEGFGYCMEAVHAERPRAVVRVWWRWPTQPHIPADARTWRRWMKASVRDGTFMPFGRLKHRQLYEFEECTAARSWSLVKFLFERHPKKFVQWVNLLREKRWREKHWQEAFFEVFRWRDADVDRAWWRWVAGRDEANSRPLGR